MKLNIIPKWQLQTGCFSFEERFKRNPAFIFTSLDLQMLVRCILNPIEIDKYRWSQTCSPSYMTSLQKVIDGGAMVLATSYEVFQLHPRCPSWQGAASDKCVCFSSFIELQLRNDVTGQLCVRILFPVFVKSC